MSETASTGRHRRPPHAAGVEYVSWQDLESRLRAIQDQLDAHEARQGTCAHAEEYTRSRSQQRCRACEEHMRKLRLEMLGLYEDMERQLESRAFLHRK